MNAHKVRTTTEPNRGRTSKNGTPKLSSANGIIKFNSTADLEAAQACLLLVTIKHRLGQCHRVKGCLAGMPLLEMRELDKTLRKMDYC